MLVHGVAYYDVYRAINRANERFQILRGGLFMGMGNIEIKNMEDKSTIRTVKTRLTLRQQDIDSPGCRWGYHAYRMGLTNYPHRSRNSCFHAYGAVMVEIYKINPETRIDSGSMHLQGGRYRNRQHFLETYESVGQNNVGSEMHPVIFKDSCNCHLFGDPDEMLGADGLTHYIQVTHPDGRVEIMPMSRNIVIS